MKYYCSVQDADRSWLAPNKSSLAGLFPIRAKTSLSTLSALVMAAALGMTLTACASNGSGHPINAIRQSTPESSPQTGKSKPKPGDMLGYTKEESKRRTDAEVRSFLDQIRYLHSEPGAFASKKNAFAALNARAGIKISLQNRTPPPLADRGAFSQKMLPHGVFARPGWSGEYRYLGEFSPSAGRMSKWQATFIVSVNPAIQCIDSRAVEGYLNLFLHPVNVEVRGFSLPPELWDRHGVEGEAFAVPPSEKSPYLHLGFTSGCFTSLRLSGTYLIEEIGNDNVFDE